MSDRRRHFRRDSSAAHESLVDGEKRCEALAGVLGAWAGVAEARIACVANACLEAALWAAAHPPPGRIAVVVGGDVGGVFGSAPASLERDFASAFRGGLTRGSTLGGHRFVAEALGRLEGLGYECVAVVGAAPAPAGGDAAAARRLFVEWAELRVAVVSDSSPEPEPRSPPSSSSSQSLSSAGGGGASQAAPDADGGSLRVAPSDALAIIGHLQRVEPYATPDDTEPAWLGGKRAALVSSVYNYVRSLAPGPRKAGATFPST